MCASGQRTVQLMSKLLPIFANVACLEQLAGNSLFVRCHVTMNQPINVRVVLRKTPATTTTAFKSLYSNQFSLSTQSIKTNFHISPHCPSSTTNAKWCFLINTLYQLLIIEIYFSIHDIILESPALLKTTLQIYLSTDFIILFSWKSWLLFILVNKTQ